MGAERKSESRSEHRQRGRDAPARSNSEAQSQRHGPTVEGMGNRALLSLLRSGAMQRKARIAPPSDTREREADRAADAVVSGRRAPPPASASHDHADGPEIQRAASEYDQLSESLGFGPARGSAAAPSAPPDEPTRAGQAFNSLAGGRKLEDDTRRLMERRFGQDFASVRVYTDHRAGEAADSVSARAFTVGDDVVFAAGEYAPETTDGKRLLAHELAHVVQQRRGPSGGAPHEAERDAHDAAQAFDRGGAPSVRASAEQGTVQRQEKPEVATTKPEVTIERRQTVFPHQDDPGTDRFAVRLQDGVVGYGDVHSDVRVTHDKGRYDEIGPKESITVWASKYLNQNISPTADAAIAHLHISELTLTFVETDTGAQYPYTVRAQQPTPVQPHKPVTPPRPKPVTPRAEPAPRPAPQDIEPKEEPTPSPHVKAEIQPSSVQDVRAALQNDRAKAARLAPQMTDDDFRALNADERGRLLKALADQIEAGQFDAETATRLISNTPDDQVVDLQRKLDADGGRLALDLALSTKGVEGRDLNRALMDVWTRSKMYSSLFDFAKPSERDPNAIRWAGRPPSWAKDLKYWKDAEGHTNMWTPELGLATWDAEGRRLGLPPPGAENIQRTLRAMEELQRYGGKRNVAGKGLLDDAQWGEHIESRIRQLSGDVNRKFDYLSGGVEIWNQIQDESAPAPKYLSHLLGGRSLDDPDKFVAAERQDILIAVNQMRKARTPTELAEAEQHLKFASQWGERQFSNYKDDIQLGGERTITAIKVGAVVATAYVAAPAIMGALAAEGGVATMSLGGKLLVVSGTSLGTGLLTGTMGGALETVHRGASWENYGRGFADYAPVGFGYGLGFGLGGAFNASSGLLRGIAIDAGTSSLSSMADRGLHGGDWAQVGEAGAQGLLTGGLTAGFARGLNFRSPLAHIGFGVGTATGLAWLGGADGEELYRQALLAGAMSAGGLLGEHWAPSSGPARAKWWRTHMAAAAMRLGVGFSEVPGLGGRSFTPNLPNEPLSALVFEPQVGRRAGGEAAATEPLDETGGGPRQHSRGESFESEETDSSPAGPITRSLPGLKVQKSPGMIILGANDVSLNGIAAAIQPEPGYHDVLAHSRASTSLKTVSYVSATTGESVRITAEVLNQLLRENGIPDGAPIRLFACSSGLCDSGVAGQLAKLRKGFVLAPSALFGVDTENGVVTLGVRSKLTHNGEDIRLHGAGAWRLFAPDGKATPLPDYEVAGKSASRAGGGRRANTKAGGASSRGRRIGSRSRESEEVEVSDPPSRRTAPPESNRSGGGEEPFTFIELGAGDLGASLDLARRSGARVIAVDPNTPIDPPAAAAHAAAVSELESRGGRFVKGTAADIPEGSADHVFQYFPYPIGKGGAFVGFGKFVGNRFVGAGTQTLIVDTVHLLKPGGAAHFVTEDPLTAQTLAKTASQLGLRAVITETTANAAAPGASGVGLGDHPPDLKVLMVNIYKE